PCPPPSVQKENPSLGRCSFPPPRQVAYDPVGSGPGRFPRALGFDRQRLAPWPARSAARVILVELARQETRSAPLPPPSPAQPRADPALGRTSLRAHWPLAQGLFWAHHRRNWGNLGRGGPSPAPWETWLSRWIVLGQIV